MSTAHATGHRLQKITERLGAGDHVGEPTVHTALAATAKRAVSDAYERGVRRIWIGCASGWDLAMGTAAINAGMSISCAIPWDGWRRGLGIMDQLVYDTVVSAAHPVVFTSASSQQHQSPADVCKACDAYMIAHSTACLALWDGRNYGGTAHTIRLAMHSRTEIVNYWDDFLAALKYSEVSLVTTEELPGG